MFVVNITPHPTPQLPPSESLVDGVRGGRVVGGGVEVEVEGG